MATLPQSHKRTDAGRIPGPYNIPSVLEIKCQMLLPNSKQTFFIVHGAYTSQPASIQSVATALFGSISAAWGTNLASLAATATQFQNVYVRDMTAFTNPVSVGTGTAVPGTSASPAMPVNAAIVITEQVVTRGRGAKGRIFLGGWATNADAGGGVISAAAQTGLNAFCTALFNAITGQSLTPCVAQPARQAYLGVTGTSHAARGSAGPPPTGTHVNVSTYLLRDLVWDTQRRRIQA